MATDYTNEVQKLYVAYFGRPADPTGLNFWTNQLQTNPNFYQTISATFSTSNEFKAMYAGLDNRALVTEIYDNMFARAPDADGLNFWVNALNNGTISFDNAVSFIANGARNNDAIIINGKVSVATEFTKHIDTDAERAAYDGMAANQIAIDYISGVKDIMSGAQRMDAGQIDATIAKIVGTPSGMTIDDIALVG
ncbi:DUF4214 domain-containing protein [Massilia sp. BKSP1R2A-1]|uniref:DUF4214 domain-containing protein n=1 Tax=Massilia sp. BKSP1R2A-1 TaxID=3422595 RepID=UPI003D326CBD